MTSVYMETMIFPADLIVEGEIMQKKESVRSISGWPYMILQALVEFLGDPLNKCI